MKLREWDWDLGQDVQVDYPEPLVVEFVNWLRTTKAWHDDVELVHRRLLALNRQLAAHRQAAKEAAAATARAMVAPPKRSRREVATANLAKARAAKAAKRAVGQEG